MTIKNVLTVQYQLKVVEI